MDRGASDGLCNPRHRLAARQRNEVERQAQSDADNPPAPGTGQILPETTFTAGPVPPRRRYASFMPSGPVFGLLVVLGIFMLRVGFRVGLGTFLSLGNIQVLVHDNTIVAIAALGALLVIISGGIDLSVGSVVALVMVVIMQVYRLEFARTGSMAAASALAIPAGIGVGALCGFMNGLIITLLRVPPFVTTLGMLSVARGVAIWIAGRMVLSFPSGARPGWVAALAQTDAGTLVFYPGFGLLFLLAALTALLLHRTVRGRHCYAICWIDAPAILIDVGIERNKVIVSALAAQLTGVVAVPSFSHACLLAL